LHNNQNTKDSHISFWHLVGLDYNGNIP